VQRGVVGWRDHAVGLQHVRDSVSPRGERHRENDEVAAEVNMNDLEIGPIPAEPSAESGCTQAGETGSGTHPSGRRTT
jgi:hypothetical protein